MALSLLSDDDLPDVPLMQRIARQNAPDDKGGSLPSSIAAKAKNSVDPAPSGPVPKTASSSNIATSAMKRSHSFQSIEISDDEDDALQLIPKKIQKKNPAAPSSSIPQQSLSRESDLITSSSSSSSTSLSSGSDLPPSVLSKQSSKQEEKRRKEEEKLRKKLEKEKEAAVKKVEAQRKKALRPGEAPKCIVVDLDTKLLEAHFGGLLLQEIQTLGVRMFW